MKDYFVGIDLGGTFIKGGILDAEGKILLDTSIQTEADKGGEKIIENIIRLARKLIEDSKLEKTRIRGIGIGIPGMIDSKAGIVMYSNNLNWKNVPMIERVQQATGIPTKITNDANAAALGEARFGAAKDMVHSVFITLGTGVGGGIIIDRKIYEGNKSLGAELGHMVIQEGGKQCTCGRKGCWEAYASASALVERTKVAIKANPASKMNEVPTEMISGKTPFDYYEKDETAKKVIDEYLYDLATGLVNIACIFRPEAIIIGGGVSAQGERLIRPLQKILNDELFESEVGAVKILTAKLGNKAGFMGSAALNMV